MIVTSRTETRVCYVPVTPYARRFWLYNDEPKPYFGYIGGAGQPDIPATMDGFAQDTFALTHYLGWVEERTVYEVEPGSWEVV